MSKTSKLPVKDPKALLRRFMDSFPGIKWTSYKFINEGWNHDVLILDNKIVLRFPNDKEYLRRLKKEVKTLKLLNPYVSVKIPDYTYIAPDYSFAGYPLILGEQLSKELFDSLKPSEHTEIAVQLANFLSTMHSMVQNGHDFTFVSPSDMKQQQRRVKRQSKQYLQAVLSKEDFLIVERILYEADRLLVQELPCVLSHGDLYHSHLLWDKKNHLLGVIDFSDMNLGDPAVDFAELWEYGKDFINEVYGYYTGPKDDTLLERAWTYQRWISVFMMVNHFAYHKNSFEASRETFDRVK